MILAQQYQNRIRVLDVIIGVNQKDCRKKMLKKLLYLLYILCNICFLHASSNINENLNCTNTYYFDTEQKLKIDEISKENFQEMDKNSFSFGIKKGNLWLKISCTNTNAKNLILTTNEAFYETANLFNLENNSWEKQENGLLLPISQRGVKSKLLSFHIDIPFNQSKTYYLQLNAKYNYVGKIEIFEDEDFFLHEMLQSNILFTFLFGIFILIVATNTFFYVTIKEKIYLYYSLYAFCTLVYLVIASGMLAYVGMQQYIYKLYAFAPLAMASFILFTKEVLETKKYFSFLDKYAKFLIIPFLILAVLVFIQYNPWNNIINIYTLVINIILLFASFYIVKKSPKKSLTLYSIGLICYFINLILSILFGLGILEYNLYTRNGMVIGIFLEMAFFQILIVKKYQEIKRNELSLKNELINIEIVKNIELENTVERRTIELKNLLMEREVLLKEVHHRVKNNFHSLIGILWMEDEKNNSTKNVELINRLKAISKIHENLSSIDNLKFIELDKYLDEIITNLKMTSTIEFDIKSSIEDIVLPFETTMSLGVIINEMITNSIKHNNSSDSLKIELEIKTKDNFIVLQILDNNKEFKSEKTGLGLSIIKHFASILFKSSYEFYYENGNKFVLKFQENRGREKCL